jgi:HSP20 family protein
MTIVRWEPLRELTSLQADMNRLFNATFAGPVGTPPRWAPAMDLLEKTDGYILRADLPGMKQDDLALQVEDNVLTVSGARKHDAEQDVAAYHRSERPHGAFSRAVTLPKGVDADGVTASFTDSVLEVRIPKPEQAQPRRIEIAAADLPAAIEA